MTLERPTEAELEAQLLRLSRSRRPATTIQAQVTATRTVLMRRQREREAFERAERGRERGEERQQRSSEDGEQLDEATRRAWFEMDLLSDMAVARGWRVLQAEWRSGSERVLDLQVEAEAILAAADPYAAFEAWRASLGGN